MARRRRGGLNEDDLRLWAQVASTAKPLARQPAAPVKVQPSAAPVPFQASAPVAAAAPAPKLSSFRVGQSLPARASTAVLSPDPASRLAAQGLRMDSKAHRKLRQGRSAPEARIDLHGMTLSVAEPALSAFILRQQAAGRRLVLVITGKGRRDMPDAPLPVRPGALRHYVPHWLQRPPLSAVVQQVVPAHFRHGGEGAYYVYLRR